MLACLLVWSVSFSQSFVCSLLQTLSRNNSLGLYRFAECGDVINPTLGLRRGENYTFVQADRTNFFHPFGVHGATNIFTEGTTTAVVLERQDYEQVFHAPPHLWAAHDDFSVHVRVEDPLVTETTYYCLIHHGMEGVIRILPPVESTQQQQATTTMTTTGSSNFVDTRSDFDKKCGTTGLGDFQLPNRLCPDRFVCGTELVSEELKEFSDCLEAANCAMMSGMTTGM